MSTPLSVQVQQAVIALENALRSANARLSPASAEQLNEEMADALHLVRQIGAGAVAGVSEPARPKIVCITGSTRFCEEHAIQRWGLEKKGIIAIGINLLPSGRGFAPHHQAEVEGVKKELDELSLRKVELADELLVINVGGYIGESTREDIEHAARLGKPIVYLEPPSHEE